MATTSPEWGAIFAWLRQDAAIKDWLTDGEADSIANRAGLNTEELIKALQYQGFDIKRILKLMIENKAKYDAAHSEASSSFNISYTDDGVKKEYVYTDNRTMGSDIMVLTSVFLTRAQLGHEAVGPNVRTEIQYRHFCQ